MTKSFFIILTVLFSFCFGQRKYSISEILNTFPLNKTAKIKIISYNIDFISEFPAPLPPIGGKIDSTVIKKIIISQKFPIKLESIIGNKNLDGIKQTKTLNFKEILELSKLLFNTCGKFSSEMRKVSMCFFPRNAILFYDENDKVFETLEICFECHRMEYNLEKSLEINEMCDSFYPKLEKFFQIKGLQTQYNRK